MMAAAVVIAIMAMVVLSISPIYLLMAAGIVAVISMAIWDLQRIIRRRLMLRRWRSRMRDL